MAAAMVIFMFGVVEGREGVESSRGREKDGEEK